MPDVISSLVAVIGADISGLRSGLNSARGMMGDMSAQMRQAGAALTAGLTVPILGFLTASVKAASDNQTAMVDLTTAIKNAGAATGVTVSMAEKLAESLSKTTRFSKDTILESETLLATFKHIGAQTFPEAERAAQDMATALKMDLGSATKELALALDNPEKGLTRLSRAGIIFTEQQKEQIKQMVKAGDLLGAQRIVLDQVEGRYRGAAAAAGTTFAGQMDILNHSFTDFQEKVGYIIIPILEDFMKHISDLVSGLNNLNPNILRIGLVAAVALAALGPVLGILGSIGTVIGVILSPIGLLIAAVAALALAWATDFGGIREKVMPILKEVANFITQTAIPALQKLWTDVQPALQSLANWFLKDALPWIIATVQFFLIATWNPLVKAIQEFWTLVSPALTSFSNWFAQNIGPILTDIQNLIDKFNLASTTLSKGLNLPGNAVGQSLAGVLTPTTAASSGMSLGFDIGAQLHDRLFGGFNAHASGGFVGAPQMSSLGENGPEFVVPSQGQLVLRGGGNQTIHVILQAQNFEDHLYVNVAQAMAAGIG